MHDATSGCHNTPALWLYHSIPTTLALTSSQQKPIDGAPFYDGKKSTTFGLYALVTLVKVTAVDLAYQYSTT